MNIHSVNKGTHEIGKYAQWQNTLKNIATESSSVNDEVGH